jgi:hypothetical protein
MAEKKEQVQVSVSREELIPYIMKQGEAVAKQVREARKKYGDRYNNKNKVEEMYRRFGNPLYRSHAEMFAKEYMLILQKKSSLPATVRYPVRDICAAAMNECYHDKVVALYKKQQEEQKEKDK